MGSAATSTATQYVNSVYLISEFSFSDTAMVPDVVWMWLYGASDTMSFCY